MGDIPATGPELLADGVVPLDARELHPFAGTTVALHSANVAISGQDLAFPAHDIVSLDTGALVPLAGTDILVRYTSIVLTTGSVGITGTDLIVIQDTDWPSLLPAYEYHRLSGSFGEGRRILPTDSGIAQVSVLTRSAPDIIQVSFEITGVQLDTLQAFYEDAMAKGTDSFTYFDPITGASIRCRFAAATPPPDFMRIQSGKDAHGFGGRFFTVSFALEQLALEVS